MGKALQQMEIPEQDFLIRNGEKLTRVVTQTWGVSVEVFLMETYDRDPRLKVIIEREMHSDEIRISCTTHCKAGSPPPETVLFNQVLPLGGRSLAGNSTE